MKRILLLVFSVIVFEASHAQNRYLCNGRYSLQLPTKIELQSSELNTVKRNYAKGKIPQIEINTPSNRIVFQQKGLNADTKSAYSQYCRVIVEYYKEDRNDPIYGRGEQIVVDKDMLDAIYGSVRYACNVNKTPLLKFLTIQPLTINGFPVLFYTYRRKGWEGKQPPVIVKVYQIFNRYESVTLTFSYREAEREKWKDIHKYITTSFSFTKKH